MIKKTVFLLLFPIWIFAQNQVQGIVLDSNTNNPLPFATLTTNTNFGDLTDTNGKFNLNSKSTFTELKISYVGYKTTVVTISNKPNYLVIKLIPSIEKLNEIVINAATNPAIQLIKKTINNRNINNINTTSNTYKYKSYVKTLVTANPDSINGSVDSIFTFTKGIKKFYKLDSTNLKFKKDIEKKHLFISEKISEFDYEKGNRKEHVLALRMAGLDQPIYEYLTLNFQDFSFYKNTYTLAGTSYKNPISNNAINYYNYKILDTVTDALGKSILVYFKPKSVKNTSGMEGVLYINTKQYALSKVIAEIKGIVNIKATINYNYFKNYNCWFPEELSLLIKKGKNSGSVNFFGATLKKEVSEKNDSIKSTNSESPDNFIYFISKVRNTDFQKNVPVTIKRPSETISIDKNAQAQNTTFWNNYRSDSLTSRGKEAYIYLDSLSKKEGVEKKLNIFKHLIKGKFPTKYVNFNLGKIISLNNYEGLRLGIGAETTNNFSKFLKLETYIAYGTKDTKFKYGITAETPLIKTTNTWLGIGYKNDLKEAAALDFSLNNASFSPFNPRNLNLNKFYQYKTAEVFLKHDIQPNLVAKFILNTGYYHPLFSYQYISPSKNFSNYNLTTAVLGFLYTPYSTYLNSPNGKITVENNYPQFTFQLTKSFENIFKSNFNFTQFNFRIIDEIGTRNSSQLKLVGEGGIVLGEAPISHLFNSTPNYTFKNPWMKRITFAGKYSFETMGYNEFISDKYVALHIKYELKPFKISSKFKPQLTLVTRSAIGSIKNPTYQTGISFKSLDKGYMESGMEINNLIKGLGLSGFYRYGAYSNKSWSDNLAVKLTFHFTLGF